jgi:hypothetical protein
MMISKEYPTLEELKIAKALNLLDPLTLYKTQEGNYFLNRNKEIRQLKYSHCASILDNATVNFLATMPEQELLSLTREGI